MRMLFFIQTFIILFSILIPGIFPAVGHLDPSKETVRITKSSTLPRSESIVRKKSTVAGGNKMNVKPSRNMNDMELELEKLRFEVEKLKKINKANNYENARIRWKSEMKGRNDEIHRKMESKMANLEAEFEKFNRQMNPNSIVEGNNHSEFVVNALSAIDILKHSNYSAELAKHFRILINEFEQLNGEYNSSQIEIVEEMIKEFKIIKKIGSECGLYGKIQDHWMAMVNALGEEKIKKIEQAAGIED